MKGRDAAGAPSPDDADLELEFTRCARAGGDRERLFERVVAAFRSQIRAIAGAHFPRDSHAIDDIEQDTYAEVVEHARCFDPARGSLRAWIAAIARQRARDYRRKARRIGRRHAGIDMAAGIADRRAGDAARSLEAADEIERLMGTLSPAEEHAIRRRHLHGDSCEAIAAKDGRSAKSVRGRLFRALKRLRDRAARERQRNSEERISKKVRDTRGSGSG